MSTFIDPTTRRQASNWSAQLGELSAGISPVKQQAAAGPAAGIAAPGRISFLVKQLLRRTPAEEHASRKLLANEFMSGG